MQTNKSGDNLLTTLTLFFSLFHFPHVTHLKVIFASSWDHTDVLVIWNSLGPFWSVEMYKWKGCAFLFVRVIAQHHGDFQSCGVGCVVSTTDRRKLSSSSSSSSRGHWTICAQLTCARARLLNRICPAWLAAPFNSTKTTTAAAAADDESCVSRKARQYAYAASLCRCE